METATKQLLFTDVAKQSRLQRDIIETQQRCNFLIEIYENFQPWQKITTPDLWLELVTDPAQVYDDTLIKHTEIRAEGVTIDAGALAQLFSLDRDSFLNIVAGKKVNESECKPCQKVKIKPGKTAISYQEFKEYERFLLFQNGTFELFTTAINQELEKYKLYVESEAQQAIMDHWHQLCQLLNKHRELGYVGPVGLETIAKLCKFRFVPDLGEIFIDDDTVKFEILKIKTL